MTRKELAKKINVSVDTLGNWEKNKTELIKLINLGLHADQIIKESNQFNQKLKDIRKKANSGKLQLPKNEIDSMEILDYWNPRDFDEDRVMEICRLLASTSVEKLKESIIEAMIDKDIWGGTFDYIKNQTTKKDIFSEFGKFLREMKTEINDGEYFGTGRYIVMEFNNKLNFNFSEKDIEIHDHIIIMYDIYNSRYKIENQ